MADECLAFAPAYRLPMLASQKQQIIDLFQTALAPIVAGTELQPNVALERPRDPSHGDVACNIAMQLAKPLKKNPRELAQTLVAAVLANPARNDLIDSIDIAGPGFINLRLAVAAKQAVVKAVLQEGEQYGKSQVGTGKKVLVEFVSANPTGPLHVGHGRQGALGDALSSLLETQGYDVTREFYYNDAGVQIGNLAISVQARAKGLKPGEPGWPEAAYNGDYIADIASDFLAKKTVAASDGAPVTASGDVNDIESIRKFAVTYLRREQDLDLQAFGVKFDNYYLESSLYTEGKVAAAVDALIKAGKTYEQEGALWLRTTEYGDDKDRVMRKSDETYTYFVPDVAYHITKWQRGFGKVINVQGSDHHGTIARVRAGLQALDMGVPKDWPDYVLHQMVTVMRGGEEVKISKRAGGYVTLRDLIDSVGRDATRYFLIARKSDSQMVFDIDLALSQSNDNPVYYIQYAHARVCSVQRQLAERGLAWNRDNGLEKLALLSNEHESAVMVELARYPEIIESAAANLEPQLIAQYLRDLAYAFHTWYNAHQFIVDDADLRDARIALAMATRQALENGLDLLGVSAPEKM